MRKFHIRTAISSKLERALTWKIRYISEKNFVFIISGIVGIVAGLAAVALKQSVHFIQHKLTSETFSYSYLQIVLPMLGLLITIFLARILYKEAQLGHAITDILYSISKKSGIIGKSKMYSRMVTSAFTVGLGGSAGLESPIVLTGSAIGSNIAQLVNMNYKMRTLMIGCGTAGVISAIFNAPIAGLIFSLEVILFDISVASFIPLLMASVSATMVSLVLLGEDALFSFRLLDTFNAFDIPLYIALGVVCGFISRYFTDFLHWMEMIFERIKNGTNRALVGGVLLCLAIFLFPAVYGEGYLFIKDMLNGNTAGLLDKMLFFKSADTNSWTFFGYLVALILVKTIASAITISAGGSGGTFAPSFFLGGVTGYSFAKFINLSGLAFISESNFALVGMCGVLCGVQYAPLTAIFLIAELTGGYTLFIPLMIVSAISYSTVTYFNANSPYIRDLMHRGEYVQNGQDMQVLGNLSINKIIEREFKAVPVDGKLKDMVKSISVSKRNIFPVLNEDGGLEGIVTLDDVRDIMFNPEKQKEVDIADIMELPPNYVEYGESMQSVMHKFETSQAWNLPVIRKGKYEGFVSKSRIFNVYREQVIKQQKK
ncbi:chloride channel protein [Flammeovirgaceae bacterium SG7u.111]|nr:chloride channel protein [Flammeovirgaceae bacterium SG7u.132]WPO35327.1 chloride channel protein [Flammeovirgaceae bacterium SG7u.111]